MNVNNDVTAQPDDIRELEKLCNHIRRMIITTIADAKCGHTGGSLSEVEILTTLYFHTMRIDPGCPDMAERDRFVLSKGHSSPGYYCVLAHRGYFPEETLKQFDAIDSILQGHPCMRKTPGVDMSTGSLGQGLSAGIGMCLGRDKRGMDFKVFVLMGDGEQQEGQVWEAALYAGSRKVPGLIGIVDQNKVQLAGTVEDTIPLGSLADKWKAFGWEVIECDGHDVAALVSVFDRASVVAESGPVMIIADTVKGKGVYFMEGKFQWHGKAPDEQERGLAMAELTTQGDEA